MLDLTHLKVMTGMHGILQFAQGSDPDLNSGYTLDDNARALMLVVSLGTPEVRPLALKYLTYLWHARQGKHWYNFWNQGYQTRFDSEDSYGRALIACALAMDAPWKTVRQKATLLFENSITPALSFQSPRGIAYTLLALCKHPAVQSKPYLISIQRLSQTLQAYYEHSAAPEWLWYEPQMTYCNAILPHAMLAAYQATQNPKYYQTAYDSLQFLSSRLFRNGRLDIIGNSGWLRAGQPIPLFDQQPVDAASIAFAAYEAYTISGQADFLQYTDQACRWFTGDNIHGISLVNPDGGGCYDALTEDGVNNNQGAESLLAMLGSFHLEQSLMQSPPATGEENV